VTARRDQPAGHGTRGVTDNSKFAFIRKPYQFDEMAAKIRDVLDGGEPSTRS
jgi:hypothetical protein